MKKIMFMFVFVTLLFTTSFGYTLTIKNEDYTLIREGIMPNTAISFGLNIPIVWSSNITSLEISRINQKSGKILMPESDVVITLTEPPLTSSLTKGKYVKLNNGPATISISTAGGSSQKLSVKDTIWRVQSATDGIIQVTPISSLGDITLTGHTDYNNLSSIKSNVINNLKNTGFFTSGDTCTASSLAYSPSFEYWLFSGGYQYDFSYDTQRYFANFVYDNGSKVAGSTLCYGSSNYTVDPKTYGTYFLMELASLPVFSGSGSSTNPYIIEIPEV